MAVPPSSLTTTFFTINVAGRSSFVIVQVADCASASVIEAPVWLPVPVHDQLPAVYPGTELSESAYVPASKDAPLDAPPAPEIGVGPLAVSVKSDGDAVPPSSFTTCLTSVSDGAWSSFVMVHVTSSPRASVILSGPANEPPLHSQPLAV